MSSNHIAEMAKKQLEMSKAILNAEESDDDTDDLLLLSEPIFSQDSSSATAAAPSETPEASPTTPPKIVSTTTTATPTTTFTKQDDEKINAQALRKSKNGTIPSNVTSPSQLKWYRETSKGKIRYYPCRVCQKDEALGLNLPEDWDVTKKVLIQDIRYPCLYDYQLVSLNSILPYGGQEAKDEATGVHLKEEEEEVEEPHWCTKLMEVYLKQLKLKYKTSEVDRRTEVLYLNEVLKQAHAFELESQKFAPHIREQEDALMSIKSIHSMEDDLNNDSRSIQSVGSNDSEEDNPGRHLLSKDDIRKKEVIRPGDVIAYHLHIYVAGSEEGYRTASVLSVDPKRTVILVLDSGDCLPQDTQVKRIKRIFRGKLRSYDQGTFKPLTWYKLNKDDGGDENTGAAAGLMEETKRIGAILDKQSKELREKMSGDGFAPVDILRNFKRKEKRTASEEDDEESPSSEVKRITGRKKPTSKMTRSDSLQNVANLLFKKLNPTENAFQSRGRKKEPHMTKDQIYLAVEVGSILRKDAGIEDRDGELPEKALDELANTLDISAHTLTKFLEGDDTCMIVRGAHKETEEALRNWLLSSHGPKSTTPNASPEAFTTSPESPKSTSSINSNDSKKKEKTTSPKPTESDKFESKETTRPKRKALMTSKVTNAIESTNGEAEIVQKIGTKRKRKASKISVTPDMSEKPKRQRRKAQKLDL